MLLPGMDVSAKILENAIVAAAKKLGSTLDKSCGACGDCNNPIPPVIGNSKTSAVVHCIEPSPGTVAILLEARNTIFKGSDDRFSKWPIHPVGMSNVNGLLSWHQACKHPGDELYVFFFPFVLC